MHARELVELAGVVSAHGSLLIDSERPIPAKCIEQYWTSSKVRLDRWARTLRRFSDLGDVEARRREIQWPATRGTLEEIFASEMLTRVWTAVLCGWDRRRGADDAEPVARSVLLAHLEARHRALVVLTSGSDIDAVAGAKLNRLRHRAERWADLLVGHLAATCDVAEFAANPERAGNFAADLQLGEHQCRGEFAWPLALASLRKAFRSVLDAVSPNADINGRIAASVLGCFPPDSLDQWSLFGSLWIDRLMDAADEAQGMIDRLMAAGAAE